MRNYRIILLIGFLIMSLSIAYLLIPDSEYSSNTDVDMLYNTDIDSYMKNVNNSIFKVYEGGELEREIQIVNKSNEYHIKFDNFYYIRPHNNNESSYNMYLVHNGSEGYDTKGDKVRNNLYIDKRTNKFSKSSFDLLSNYLNQDDVKIKNVSKKEYNDTNIIEYKFKKYNDNYRFGLFKRVSGEFYVNEDTKTLVYYSINVHDRDETAEFEIIRDSNMIDTRNPDWLSKVR